MESQLGRRSVAFTTRLSLRMVICQVGRLSCQMELWGMSAPGGTVVMVSGRWRPFSSGTVVLCCMCSRTGAVNFSSGSSRRVVGQVFLAL